MEEDIEICHCMGVNKSVIVKAIKEKGLKTIEEIREETSANTGCGGCLNDIEEILKEVNQQ